MRRIGMEFGIGLPERARKTEPIARVSLGEVFAAESDTCCRPVIRDYNDATMSNFRERTETGPIYVEGVKAGDMIRVNIRELRNIGGATGARRGGSVDYLPIDGGVIAYPGGFKTDVRMMIGVICVAPNFSDGEDYGDYLRYDLGDNGGNMDYRDVCAGNSICFKARNDGGLLFLGDMHAYQGFGEWLGLGAECAGEAVISVDIESRFSSDRPVIVKDRSMAFLASRWPLRDALDLAISDAVSALRRMTGAGESEARRFALLTGSATHGQNAHLLRSDLPLTPGGAMPATVGFEIPTEYLGAMAP